MTDPKSAYICGPLTELPVDIQEQTKQLYVKLAEACYRMLGIRAFVPHEHCDPIRNAELSPADVDAVERPQLCQRTSVLVVVAIAPSWGGGIEVEMANHAGVPVIILAPVGKNISRLLRGNPAVRKVLQYKHADDAQGQLVYAVQYLFQHQLL